MHLRSHDSFKFRETSANISETVQDEDIVTRVLSTNINNLAWCLHNAKMKKQANRNAGGNTQCEKMQYFSARFLATISLICLKVQCVNMILIFAFYSGVCFQCFDAVGWAAGRASGL